MIRALQSRVHADATTLVQHSGEPNRALVWSIESGPGSIAGLSTTTDATGSAWALYDPEGVEGAAVVRVTYGA